MDAMRAMIIGGASVGSQQTAPRHALKCAVLRSSTWRMLDPSSSPSATVTFAAKADCFSALERQKRPHAGRISGSLHSPVCPLTASAPVLFGIGRLFSVRGSAGPVATAALTRRPRGRFFDVIVLARCHRRQNLAVFGLLDLPCLRRTLAPDNISARIMRTICEIGRHRPCGGSTRLRA